jgi:hypothetical protein
MTESDAIRRAEAGREAAGVQPGAAVSWAVRRFVEVAVGDPNAPGPVRDLLAWIVRFGNGRAWVDLAVDDRTGAIVRVERSR